MSAFVAVTTLALQAGGAPASLAVIYAIESDASFQEALDSGLDEDDARNVAIVAGLVKTITEHAVNVNRISFIGGDAGIFRQAVEVGILSKTKGGRLMAHMVIEGFQEVFQEGWGRPSGV